MKINLDNIFENDGEVLDFNYIIEDCGSDFSADMRFVGGIKVTGYVANRSGTVVLTGIGEFDFSAPCDRCAAETKKHFSVPFTHKLINHLYGEDNDEYIIVEDAVLNLDELVYEDIILSLPMRYLCKDDCKGLCPMCGADLNKVDCGCKKPTDPRLDALKQLLEI